MFEFIETGLQQGLIIALISFGMMIPYRFLNFPDLSAEGAYPLGAAVCARLMILGLSPLFAVLGGLGAGGMLGVITAYVALELHISSLLAGIIVSSMAYTLNLRIMAKPSLCLFNIGTGNYLLYLLLLVLLISAIFGFFLYTDYGLRFRAVGLNLNFAQKQHLSIKKYTVFGLFVSGALFGLAGGMIALMQRFVDVSMGSGIAIHGLASLMLGETIVGNDSIQKQLIAPICGAMIYQQIQGLVLLSGLAPTDLKLFSGLVLIGLLCTKKYNSHQKP